MTLGAATRAAIVVDLGFGDSGKGLVTDALVRRLGASAVVRWNGGAQAGHTVVAPDGRAHTFSQFGAGSFVPGVRTYLASAVVVHPTALAVEATHLARVGVTDALARLAIAADARVITPVQQAMGRLRELARGDARHGSCGVGVGETVADSLARPDEVLRMQDLASPIAARKLARLREGKRDELAALGLDADDPRVRAEFGVFEDPSLDVRWLDAARAAVAGVETIAPEELGARLFAERALVLEGAQGILLDEWRGFHPHTSYGTCTTEPARALLAGFAPESITTLGVLRTFATRHGAGPFPTEDPALAAGLVDPHNPAGPWQGGFRVGPLDLVLARYALAVSGEVDGLAITHLDALPKLDRIATGYRVSSPDPALFELDPEEPTRVVCLRPGRPRDLEHQAALGAALTKVTPDYEPFESRSESDFVARIEHALARPIRMTSRGPSSDQVTWRE